MLRYNQPGAYVVEELTNYPDKNSKRYSNFWTVNGQNCKNCWHQLRNAVLGALKARLHTRKKIGDTFWFLRKFCIVKISFCAKIQSRNVDLFDLTLKCLPTRVNLNKLIGRGEMNIIIDIYVPSNPWNIWCTCDLNHGDVLWSLHDLYLTITLFFVP